MMSPLLATRAGASARGYGLFGSSISTSYSLIQQQNLSSATSVTFSSIPSTYKSLQLRWSTLVSVNGAWFGLNFNNDFTSIYATHYLEGSGSTVTIGGQAAGLYSYARIGNITTFTTYPNVGIVDIIDYSNTSKYKVAKILNGANQNSSSGLIGIDSALYLSTNAINALTITAVNGGPTMTGTFSLYGIN